MFITCTQSFSAKTRSKKVKGKTRGERDLLKERLLRRDNSVPDDKDETSSTTTDSSAGGDQDDKVSCFCSFLNDKLHMGLCIGMHVRTPLSILPEHNFDAHF